MCWLKFMLKNSQAPKLKQINQTTNINNLPLLLLFIQHVIYLQVLFLGMYNAMVNNLCHVDDCGEGGSWTWAAKSGRRSLRRNPDGDWEGCLTGQTDGLVHTPLPPWQDPSAHPFPDPETRSTDLTSEASAESPPLSLFHYDPPLRLLLLSQ